MKLKVTIGTHTFIATLYNNAIATAFKANLPVTSKMSVAFRLFSKKLAFVQTEQYKTLDVSGNLLAGYKLARKLDINVRYSNGLLNILKDDNMNGMYLSKTSLKNRFLNLSILYYLK